ITATCWQHLFGRWQQWLQAVETEQFQLQWGGPTAYCCWCGATAEPSQPEEPLNAGLARYYHQQLEQRALEQARSGLGHRLEASAERQRRQQAEQERLLAQVENADALQQQADQLLCLPRPSREQIDAAQGLYRRARKLRRSVAAIGERLEQNQRQLAWLEASLTFLEQADSRAQIEALAEELAAQTAQGRQRSERQQPARPGPLELLAPSGLRLLVGRNHRQNEAISLRQASRGDLWFHAQECPGSHVVLKSSEAPASEADRQAGADLAAHFSRARGNSRVSVLMVPVEQLQRLPGSEAGTVRHRGGELLWGEPARAELLLPTPGTTAEEPRSLGAAPTP
ncbi:MAG: NFACT RNA binding domain-containing protein, partial [Prochlorococcaceae cyanobacterium]